MAYTVTQTLTASDASASYADIDAWTAVHGWCATNATNAVTAEHTTSATLTLNADGRSVTRTFVYENEAARTAHVAAMGTNPNADKAWIVTNQSAA